MVCGFGRRKESGARIPWHGIALPGIQTPKILDADGALMWYLHSLRVGNRWPPLKSSIPIPNQSQLQFAHRREEKIQAIL